MDKIAHFLNAYASVPVWITAAYAALRYRQLGKELRVFAVFLWLSGAVELVSRLLWQRSINNLPLLHFYVAAGFICLSWFYSTVLRDFINQKIIWGIAAAFTVFTLLNSAFVQGIYEFNSYALSVQAILILIVSIFTYLLLLNDIVRERRSPALITSLNWINSGLFIYYTSSLLIFYFGDLFTDRFPVFLNQYTWAFHAVFLAVMHTCIFIGLWKQPKK